MKDIKKLMITLVALLAVTTGAWATDTYTVQFKANGNTKTVENVTLPKKFSCDYDNENGELDLIIKQLYGLSGGCCGIAALTSSSENVTCGLDGHNQFITINAPFEGTATVTGLYFNEEYTDFDYSLEISIPGYTASASAGPEVAWDKAEKTGSFDMPGGNVEQ